MKTVDVASLLTQVVSAANSGGVVRAARLCRQVLEIDPGNIDALHLMGVLTHQAGRYEEAADWSTRALERAPGSVQAYSNRAATFIKLARFDDAIRDCRLALGLQPTSVDAMMNLSSALLEAGRLEEAQASYRRVLALVPNFVAALLGASRALRLAGMPESALKEARRAVELAPALGEAWFELGAVLQAQNALAEALRCHDRAIEIEPRSIDARLNRARLRFFSFDYSGVLEDVRFVPAEHIRKSDSVDMLVYAKLNVCDWTGFDAWQVDLKERVRAKGAVSVSYNALVLLEEPSEVRTAIGIIASRSMRPSAVGKAAGEQTSQVEASVCAWSQPVLGASPLRCGFVSADFREHPSARLVAPFITLIDRSRVRPIGISLSAPDGSDEGRAVRAAFDEVVDIGHLSDGEAMSVLRSLDLDVAIDLMGHTAGSRPDLFHHRIAPTQASFLGFPSTTGMAEMDYVLADAVVAPDDDDGEFAETVCRLPGCYYPPLQIGAIATEDAGSRANHGLPENAVVLAVFCNSWKLSPTFLDIWARILKRAPKALLWILADSELLRTNLRTECRKRGVGSDRVVFAPRARYAAHMARHRHVDVLLDTAPYGGHTTTMDALAAGVPVVTVPGRTFASRVAASMLQACELHELIADSVDAYENLAVTLATDEAERHRIQRRVAGCVAASPLLDAQKFARKFGAAVVQMSRRRISGDPVVDFGPDALF